MVAYLIAPIAGWVVAGSLKFAINTLRSGSLAWNQIGYGGLPSTHTTIVSTTGALIGLREGWNTPAFSLAAAMTLIVVLDATSLRRYVGAHARALNALRASDHTHVPLRERVGHRWIEVLAGVAVGALTAGALHGMDI